MQQKKKGVFLKGLKTKQKVKLMEKNQINHNSFIFKCELPKDKILGLPVGQHIRIYSQHKNEEIKRSFTPISYLDQ